jgi:hypothetical protein
MNEWVLVAIFMTNINGIDKVDYDVIDYYNTKKECTVVLKKQHTNTNRSYKCLPRDKA